MGTAHRDSSGYSSWIETLMGTAHNMIQREVQCWNPTLGDIMLGSYPCWERGIAQGIALGSHAGR